MEKTVSTKWGDWNRQQFLLLRREYRKASERNLLEFKVGEQQVVTQFAKYLLEYLSPQFGCGEFTE